MDLRYENNPQTKNERRKWLTHYTPLVIWIVLILGLGSPMGSMNETSRFIRPLLEFLFPAASPETLTAVHGIIRKFAHFAEYAVLGFLAFRIFAGFIRFRYTSAIALVLMVAATDEINQSFNPSRTSSIVDVGIDLLGGIMAVLACAALSRHVRSAKPGPGKSR